jgi:hypothetical protein
VEDVEGASATVKAPSMRSLLKLLAPTTPTRNYLCQIEPKSGGVRRCQAVCRLPKTSRSYRSPLAQGRFPIYLSLFPDQLLADRCLESTDHPLLRSGSSTVIGSVHPLIGRGPINLWA